MTLNENIREVRREKNMTQEALAEAMGVSTASVSKWETGQCAPELLVLTALADFFEMSVDALLGHEVKADRRKTLLEEMKQKADENRFEEAKELGQKLLRNYPNDYDVVEQVSSLYYRIHVCTDDRASMEYSIELVRRLFSLADDPDGTKRLELLSCLGNQYEMLKEWDMARKCYEESNVAGMNDRALARILADEKGDMQAAEAVTKVFVHSLFEMLVDVMRLQQIWEKLGQPEKARAALQWGITALEAAGSEAVRTYSTMGMAMHMNMANLDEQAGDNSRAKEHVRKAVRMAKGTAAVNASDFLTSNMPHVSVSEWANSPETLLAILQESAPEQFGEDISEEMNNL